MSIQTAFPDAIVFPDGTIRLVTDAAKRWAHASTNIDRWCELSTVPDYVDFDDSIPPLLEGKGLVVQWKQMPVNHYRSKRRKWPKSTVNNDGTAIDFLQRIPKQHRKRAISRAHARQRARNHRKMQERDEKRQEALQEEQTVE